MTDEIPQSDRTTGLALSAEDVRALLEDPSAESREAAAIKVAGALSRRSLNAAELPIAQDILRVMAQDAEERVRAALAREARSASDLPHDVALTLAKDVASVSLPILEFSELLNDEDLLSVIASSDEMKQVAVARRTVVSESVSDALIEVGTEETVATLMGNRGAKVSETSMHKVVDKFGDSERVQEHMVHRDNLPITVSERLVSLVSERLLDHLITHHVLSSDMASDLLLQTRERATLGLISDGAPPQSVEDLVNSLYRNGRLTESIVLRAACLGDLDFLEASTAKLAGVSLANAQVLFDDSGDRGLRALFRKTGLPVRTYPVLRKAVDVMRETEYDGLPMDRERFSKRILERLLTAFETDDFGLGEDDIDYLMVKLNALTESTTDLDGAIQ